jgi:cysteine desulfurase
MTKKNIYFDNAATTQVDQRVLKAMLPYFTNDFGNASSLHSFGQEAEGAVLKSKDIISDFLNCEAKEIVFTSGGTESNNTVLKSVFNNYQGHLITSAFEHPSVLDTAKYLKSKGVEVTFIKPEANGLIDPQKVLDAIQSNTKLISIMYVNNEIGTIQPIGKIAKDLEEINKDREEKILFHTDAVQATYFATMDITRLRVDFLSLSGHKIYGPKGVGALYIKDGIKITPLLHGGHQENGFRAGTYNVPSIVGLGKAVSLINTSEHTKEVEQIKKLRDVLIEKVLKIEGASLNGDQESRLANNANFLFQNVEGESLLLKLDMEGVACSTGSACASGSLQASHVLLAIGVKPENAHGSLRISIGKDNTIKDINHFVKVLEKIVKELRSFSPLK